MKIPQVRIVERRGGMWWLQTSTFSRTTTPGATRHRIVGAAQIGQGLVDVAGLADVDGERIDGRVLGMPPPLAIVEHVGQSDPALRARAGVGQLSLFGSLDERGSAYPQ